MNKSLRRLKDLISRSPDYEYFKRKVKVFRWWYMSGLERWTNADLMGFYVHNGGK